MVDSIPPTGGSMSTQYASNDPRFTYKELRNKIDALSKLTPGTPAFTSAIADINAYMQRFPNIDTTMRSLLSSELLAFDRGVKDRMNDIADIEEKLRRATTPTQKKFLEESKQRSQNELAQFIKIRTDSLKNFPLPED